jgi:anthranilate 1,2-dioxygenase large subunit/terephthalate 1,2-dioxygenase oxygenase component alpha subunit
MEEQPMSLAPETAHPAWPQEGLTRVPFRLYADEDIYRRELQDIFRGPVWNYLCLACELPEPGDFRVTAVGEIPVVVTRDRDGALNAFVNRCAHRGALLCLKQRGHVDRSIACVYHAWTYDLKGDLTSVAFRRGIKQQGGMPADFRLEDHNLEKLRVTEFAGLVFGTFSDDTPDIETYLGPEIAARIRRVLNRPLRILGTDTQVLNNNWKLYVENVKDSYHASLLHLFFTTFELNRLSQRGGVIVDDSGGHHVSYSIMDKAVDNAEYRKEGVRAANDRFRLADPSMLMGRDEFGDGITLQILTVFPGLVVQQIQNAIAVRQVLPTGPERMLLNWTYLGYEDDDEEMTELRLKQANLVGPSGYISMEDGAVGGFVQRATVDAGDAESVLEMGGSGAESQDFRATETSVRGFWKKYRALMDL